MKPGRPDREEVRGGWRKQGPSTNITAVLKWAGHIAYTRR
jgi:hypothetical protein